MFPAVSYCISWLTQENNIVGALFICHNFTDIHLNFEIHNHYLCYVMLLFDVFISYVCHIFNLHLALDLRPGSHGIALPTFLCFSSVNSAS